jgi:hypothetical protein
MVMDESSVIVFREYRVAAFRAAAHHCAVSVRHFSSDSAHISDLVVEK